MVQLKNNSGREAISVLSRTYQFKIWGALRDMKSQYILLMPLPDSSQKQSQYRHPYLGHSQYYTKLEYKLDKFKKLFVSL